MHNDLFISYSHQDKDFVRDLCADLDRSGVSYFLDEKEIEWGISIGKSVTEGLSRTAGILLILSPGSLKSAWVPFEIGYASARGKQVLPLLTHPALDPPGYLGDIKYFVGKDAAIKYFQSTAWRQRAHTARILQGCRDLTITEAAQRVGLVDVEDRQNDRNVLPPTEFYVLAKREIAISGVSAFRTFDQHFHILQRALDDGKRVYVLIIAPDAPVVPLLAELHKLDIQSQIEDVINRIIRANLAIHPNFRIRFLKEVPTFTANMIDGDLKPDSSVPDDTEGQIRVQPATKHQTQHRGMVYQFAKVSGGGGFDLFAADFRDQWAKDGTDRPDLGL